MLLQVTSTVIVLGSLFATARRRTGPVWEVLGGSFRQKPHETRPMVLLQGGFRETLLTEVLREKATSASRAWRTNFRGLQVQVKD
jgi:hypothetical protein